MYCRTCRIAFTGPSAGWAELVGHAQDKHPEKCKEVEGLSAAQVVEQRQRLQSVGSAGNGAAPRGRGRGRGKR